jgi:hypothetical protein
MPEAEIVKEETPAEKPVDWSAAEEFFTGKQPTDETAGDETPDTDAAELVEVRIKGKTVKMTAEAAEAYNAFVRETRERDGRLGGELARLKESQARLEGKIEGTVRATRSADDDLPKPPPAKLAIDDFEEYHRQMLAYHGAMMLRQQSEIEGKYEQDQTSKSQAARQAAENERWVNSFYAEHAHLNKEHLRPVIQSVYKLHSSEIEELNQLGDTSGARERLAELVDATLLKLKQDGKEVETNRKQPPRLEGAGAVANGKGRQEKQFTPTTASAWVARKRAEMRGVKK